MDQCSETSAKVAECEFCLVDHLISLSRVSLVYLELSPSHPLGHVYGRLGVEGQGAAQQLRLACVVSNRSLEKTHRIIRVIHFCSDHDCKLEKTDRCSLVN